MWCYLFTILLFLITVLDIAQIINLSHKKWLIPYLFLAPHLPLLALCTFHDPNLPDSVIARICFAVVCVFFQLYSTLRLHLHRRGKNESGSMRIGILYGGRNLIHTGLIGLYLLPFWYLLWYLISLYVWNTPYRELNYGKMDYLWITLEVLYAAIFVWLFLINGCLRIFFCSRNLGIGKRIFILLFMWVPLIQLYLAYILCKAAKDEYLVAVSRKDSEVFVKEDDVCATKYPLVMVHGIGFRDLRFFNYWGRIPMVLKQHGAQIYYGHQEAWNDLEGNASIIATTIDKVLEENNCDKVNLIAHSKGGLDCRYLISSMGYGDKVASLTTINTPHHGSVLMTFLHTLPQGAFLFFTKCINFIFKIAGDNMPDSFASSEELDPTFCEEFNLKNPDNPDVYYQSYASCMKNCFSDPLLFFPHLIMRSYHCKQNDGLVDVSSMQWGEFKGVFTNKYHRGISHGDMIDLKREDIKGFDVLHVFYEIVKELKEKGF